MMKKTFVGMMVLAGITMMAACSDFRLFKGQHVNDDNSSVELDSLSPYNYDKEQKEVTFSDDSTKLLRFPHDSEIKEYAIPEYVKVIEERAFMGCQSLKKVTIPTSVKEVGMAAFENCHSLEYVYIGAQLDTLPFRCFNYCNMLRDIYLTQATPPVIEKEEEEKESLLQYFSDLNIDSCNVCVPKGAVSAYRKAYGWRLFKNIKPIAPHQIYAQRDSDGIYCYADGLKIDLPDWEGGLAMATHELGDYVYVVGDQCPGGNGYTIRFYLYQVHRYSLVVKKIGAYPAIHFDKNGCRVAVPRVTNPEADWANQIIVMHDEYFDANGKQIRKDNREYSYEEMEKKYGKDLLNVHGLSMYDNYE